MRVTTWGLIVAIAVAGCSDDDPTLLVVDVRTDLEAVVEFQTVRVELVEESGAGTMSARSSEVTASPGDDWSAGRRAGEFGVSPGPWRIRGALLDAAGTPLIRGAVVVRAIEGRTTVATLSLLTSCAPSCDPDGGVADAGSTDSGANDAGGGDAGVPDAGAADAGGDFDAGPPPDTGTDAGRCVCDERPGATWECLDTSCVYTCDAMRGDCDTDPANGCETPLHLGTANCGACGATCAPGESCMSGGCACNAMTGGVGEGSFCVAPSHCCAAGCTDVRTDRMNCGRCGNVCPLLQNCMMGVCRLG